MARTPPLGARLCLREYRTDDVAAVLAYASDPEVTRYLPWGPEGPEEVSAFLERTAAEAREAPRRQWELAAVRRDTQELLGAGRIGIVSFENRLGDVGYVLRRDAWGKGLGGEIAELLVRFGFAGLGLHRIEATCDPENQASRRVLERAGLRCEGLVREHLLVRGRWRDSLLFGILEQEWRGDRAGAPA